MIMRKYIFASLILICLAVSGVCVWAHPALADTRPAPGVRSESVTFGLSDGVIIGRVVSEVRETQRTVTVSDSEGRLVRMVIPITFVEVAVDEVLSETEAVARGEVIWLVVESNRVPVWSPPAPNTRFIAPIDFTGAERMFHATAGVSRLVGSSSVAALRNWVRTVRVMYGMEE